SSSRSNACVEHVARTVHQRDHSRMTNKGTIDSPVAVLRESTIRAGLRLVEKSYAPGLRMPRHSHAEWRYCLALRGSYTDSWRQSSRTRTPNQLSLHPAE